MAEKVFVEDTSIKGRLAEIQEKLLRVRKGFEETGKEALLLTKHPNFSWITAGAKGFIANCFDNSAIAVLITKTKLFAICNVIEANRVVEEDYLPELGFEMIVSKWQVNNLESFVKDQVSAWDKVVSDVPLAGAVVDSKFILSVRLPFTQNEIARYLYLGEYLSRGLEEYLPTVKPGMTEYEICGGIANALWKYNVEQVMFLVSVDERADKYRHALPTDKKLEHNLLASINGRYKGLITTTTRMGYISANQSPVLLSSIMTAAIWKQKLFRKLPPASMKLNYTRLYSRVISKKAIPLCLTNMVRAAARVIGPGSI
jgi:Xaa-Pro aminopeptidase